MASNRINGEHVGPKSQYRQPTIQDRAALAVEYRKAARVAQRSEAAAYGVLERAVAAFCGFICDRCGTTTDGKTAKVQRCDHCRAKEAERKSAANQPAEVST